jgi:hypothetical protein
MTRNRTRVRSGRRPPAGMGDPDPWMEREAHGRVTHPFGNRVAGGVRRVGGLRRPRPRLRVARGGRGRARRSLTPLAGRTDAPPGDPTTTGRRSVPAVDPAECDARACHPSGAGPPPGRDSDSTVGWAHAPTRPTALQPPSIGSHRHAGYRNCWPTLVRFPIRRGVRRHATVATTRAPGSERCVWSRRGVGRPALRDHFGVGVLGRSPVSDKCTVHGCIGE